MAKVTSVSQLQQHFARTLVYQFMGKPGGAHRVFPASGAKPGRHLGLRRWRPRQRRHGIEVGGVATGAERRSRMERDGRSRPCRQMLGKTFGALRNLYEAWLVYKPTRHTAGRRGACSVYN